MYLRIRRRVSSNVTSFFLAVVVPGCLVVEELKALRLRERGLGQNVES